MCQELGFDSCKETYIKGDTSIVIVIELKKEFLLVIMLDMNELKCEFFDCD